MSSFQAILIFMTHFFVVPLGCAGQDTVRQELWSEENNGVRQSAHEFLFDEFVDRKECLFSDDKRLLTEVVVYEKRTRLHDVEEIELPKGSQRVAGMFDQLVLRGENLEKIRIVAFANAPKNRRMRLLDKLEGELALQMVPLPLPRKTAPPIYLRFVCSAPVVINEIAFRSTKHLSIDFDEYRDSLAIFPKSKDVRHKMHRAFYLETMNRNFEELSASLSESSDAFVGIIARSRMTGGLDLINIDGVLADRRVAKLYEGLSQMDSETAAKVASDNFDKEFDSYQDQWKEASILPENMIYAVEANLFLCSEFCPPESVLERIDQWHDWHRKLQDQKGFQFKHGAKPNFLFVANLHANMIIRQRQMSHAEANEWLATTLSPVMSKRSRVPVLEQEWLLTSDSTPQHADLLAYVPVFKSYGSLRDPGNQKRVLMVLRAQLDP